MKTRHGVGRRVALGGSLLAGGALAGAVLAGSLSASAATATPTPSPSATQAGPGVQENDGIPEAQEHSGGHGGHGGHGLALTGTVTAVGTGSVTIKTSTGATLTYQVTSTSDVDKNGEAELSDLAVGDTVRYSVATGTTTIDKLHAGDAAKDVPSGTAGGVSGTTGTTSAYGT